jgi:molybdopterin-guanine dinucleotide biosynthesis protein A
MRGVILAGGAAARFGGAPKGLQEVGGRRILDRVIAACMAAFDTPPLLVAGDPQASAWQPGLEVVPDLLPGHGPLGGLLTAVVRGPAPVLVVAWDMPFVSAELLRRLADGLHEADVCLPASPGRRSVEPLCAAYGPGCEPAIRAALDRGERQLVAFHHAVRTTILAWHEVAAFGDPSTLFLNVNTPDDLERARLIDAAPPSP